MANLAGSGSSGQGLRSANAQPQRGSRYPYIRGGDGETVCPRISNVVLRKIIAKLLPRGSYSPLVGNGSDRAHSGHFTGGPDEEVSSVVAPEGSRRPSAASGRAPLLAGISTGGTFGLVRGLWGLPGGLNRRRRWSAGGGSSSSEVRTRPDDDGGRKYGSPGAGGAPSGEGEFWPIY